MKRTFELIEGKSAKFWQIELDGKSHTVSYGRIGAKGSSSTKSFADDAAAKADAEKLIKAKVKKGYVEVEAAKPEAAPLDAKLLEAQLVKLDADPSAQGRVVFGDWLQSVGHPWGKLIALDHSGQIAERDALLDGNQAILGGLSKATRKTRLSWQQGFIDEAMIESGGKSAVLKDGLKELFKLPAARYLRRLVLDGAPDVLTTTRDWDNSTTNVVQPYNAVIPELAHAPKTLTELAFGDPPPTGASAYTSAPNLAAVAKILPNLEVLEVQCSGVVGNLEPFAFARLRRLDVRFSAANDADLQVIREAKLPALERLSVWLGGSVYCTLDDIYSPEEYDYDEDDDEDDDYRSRYPESYPSSDLEQMNLYSVSASAAANTVRAFCDADWPASLKHLGIQSAVLDEAMIEAISSSNVISQLETLDLSGGDLNDKTAKALVSRAARFAHLARVDLSRNQLGKKGVAALAKALPNAELGDQRKGDAAPQFLFRYVATME